MDVLAYCRSMVAFCHRRALFENEDSAFWYREAEQWEVLVSEFGLKGEKYPRCLLLRQSDQAEQPKTQRESMRGDGGGFENTAILSR